MGGFFGLWDRPWGGAVPGRSLRKNCARTPLFTLLTLIINQILDTGVFLANSKIAKIIPIFLKDDKTVFNNYRPISLLPIISKVVENVLSDQLNILFVKQKLLFDHQYGFRSGHSTEHAELELTDRIIANIDNKKVHQISSLISRKHLTP